MTAIDLKKKIQVMAKQFGKPETVRLLVIAGVSPRVSERLCDGTYDSEPKAIKDKIVTVLKEHGFLKTDEKAS